MLPISKAVRNIRAVMPIKPLNLPSPVAQTFKTMYCDVVFGSPSMDCNGTGICKISGTNALQSSASKNNCRTTSCVAAASQNGNLSLYFFRELLCAQLYRKHFHKGIFTVSEPCAIPSEVRKTLGIDVKKIMPGEYAVVENDGYFRVELIG